MISDKGILILSKLYFLVKNKSKAEKWQIEVEKEPIQNYTIPILKEGFFKPHRQKP